MEDVVEPGAVPTWDEIVDRHSDRVYRLAYRLTGNRHDAEDLTQEVFVRVFRSLSTYTPGTFEGWLHRITTNLFLDQARRKQRIRFDAMTEERADRLTSALPSRALAHRAPVSGRARYSGPVAATLRPIKGRV
jgi:RNA polymerase sigma factor (sigma-70 family)